MLRAQLVFCIFVYSVQPHMECSPELPPADCWSSCSPYPSLLGALRTLLLLGLHACDLAFPLNRPFNPIHSHGAFQLTHTCSQPRGQGHGRPGPQRGGGALPFPSQSLRPVFCLFVFVAVFTASGLRVGVPVG